MKNQADEEWPVLLDGPFFIIIEIFFVKPPDLLLDMP